MKGMTFYTYKLLDSAKIIETERLWKEPGLDMELERGQLHLWCFNAEKFM